MSTVTDVKKATEQLSPDDRWELFVWLRESQDVRNLQREELRRAIEVGLEQADCGDVAPLDISSIRSKVRERVK
ncbi:MAG TPA: hypothetical protein VGO67_06225 [Verrucomicrobiae bacterium]|jgi:hypothetical protein